MLFLVSFFTPLKSLWFYFSRFHSFSLLDSFTLLPSLSISFLQSHSPYSSLFLSFSFLHSPQSPFFSFPHFYFPVSLHALIISVGFIVAHTAAHSKLMPKCPSFPLLSSPFLSSTLLQFPSVSFSLNHSPILPFNLQFSSRYDNFRCLYSGSYCRTFQAGA